MLALLTLIHVALSLAAIAVGFVVLLGLLNSQRLDRETAWFLVLSAATTATGFVFPFHGFTPGIGIGIVSSVVLALAIAARYGFHLARFWRAVYVTAAVPALYLNVLVLIVQSFEKIPPLRALAPTQSEPPIMITQVVALVAFVVLGVCAVARFHPEVDRKLAASSGGTA